MLTTLGWPYLQHRCRRARLVNTRWLSQYHKSPSFPFPVIPSAHLSSVVLTTGSSPPWSRLLAPGVFKLSCSTPFTPFLRLVSVYWPFQLYFIPKTLHNTSVFSSLLTAYFYLTGHSPVFIYNTTLLHILLTLCGHLQTQHVCRALHPVSGEDGILVAEVPHGVQHASSARTSPRRVVGLARPNQSAGRALP